MTLCPRCDRAVADTDATCASCGQVLGASVRSSGERPAHLAILDSTPPIERAAMTGSEGNVGPARSTKPRLVSRAGPAVPALPVRDDDTVPAGAAASGWMARLEAAKRTPGSSGIAPASSSSELSGPTPASDVHFGAAEPAGEPPVRVGPPPLPPPLPSQKARAPVVPPPAFSTKPAHLLVAELEAAEAEKKREAKQRKNSALGSTQDEISKSEIAQVQIAKPDTDIAEKHIPKWVYGLAVALVLGGVAAAYVYAEKKTPVVKAEADPELRAKAERARKANALVEEGHAALEAKDPAKAIESYLSALKIDPQFARAERALGVAYAAKGDDAAAAEHYKKFLTLDPDAPEAAQVRAIVDKYEARKKP